MNQHGPTGRKIDTVGTAACIGALLFWATGPIFIKLLTDDLDAFTQNVLRYSAACLFWMPFLLLTIHISRTKEPNATLGNVWRLALIPAAANITMQSLYVGSFYYLKPAFVMLLEQSTIIWVAGFSLILFREERVLLKSRRFWFGLGLSAVGVAGVLIYKEDFEAGSTVIGIFMAMTAAVMWAVYTVSVKICLKNIDSRLGFSVISIYTVIGLSVLCLIYGDPGTCLQLSPRSWSYVVISGILSIAAAHVLYYMAIKRIGATIPGLVLLILPFLVFASSRIVFDETLNSRQILFGMVLLAGSGLAIWAQKHLGTTQR